MSCYKMDRNKRKNALRRYMKKNIKKAKVFVKICYIITGILRIIAIVLGIAMLMYIVMKSHEPIELFYLVLTSFNPWMLSYLSFIVCYGTIGREYTSREREGITINEDGFDYCYTEGKISELNIEYMYKVKYADINEIVFDDTTKILKLHGDFICENYEDSVLMDTLDIKSFDLIDAYDVSLVDIINKHIN